MKVVKLTPRAGMDDETQRLALEFQGELTELIQSGKVVSLVQVAVTTDDFVIQNHVGCEADPYRVIGAVKTFNDHLSNIFHQNYLEDA